MGQLVEIPVNPLIIRWARQSMGFTPDIVADRIGQDVSKVQAWETGSDRPGISHLEKLSTLLGIPLSTFFLPAPPTLPVMPTDFRQRRGDSGSPLTREAIKAIREAQAVQQLLQDCIDVGAAEPFNPPVSNDPEALREILGITDAAQLGWRRDSTAFKFLRDALEIAGIAVIQLQVGKGDLQGVCLANEQAPVILLNRNDHMRARIFTLAHELCHLLHSANSICAPAHDYESRRSHAGSGVEAKCNRFAADLLIPRNLLRSRAELWLKANKHAALTSDEALDALHRDFSVSKHSLLIRMLELGLVTQDGYESVTERWQAYPTSISEEGGGGEKSFERALRQYGGRVVRAAANAYAVKQITKAEFMSSLRVKESQVGMLIDGLR